MIDLDLTKEKMQKYRNMILPMVTKVQNNFY
jgi:hypothetical protein